MVGRLKICAVTLAACLIAACTAPGFTDRRDSEVDNAVVDQGRVIGTPLFDEILREVDREGALVWPDGSLDRVYGPKLASYENQTEWLIDAFADEGGFTRDQVKPWTSWTPANERQALTKVCGSEVRINRWMAGQDKYRLMNMLAHNRVISFCFEHARKTVVLDRGRIQ